MVQRAANEKEWTVGILVMKTPQKLKAYASWTLLQLTKMAQYYLCACYICLNSSPKQGGVLNINFPLLFLFIDAAAA